MNVLRENNLENVNFEGIILKNRFWMSEQPVNNKGCSSIQFLLRAFYQQCKIGARKFKKFFCGDKKVSIPFELGLTSSVSWTIRVSFSWDIGKAFWEFFFFNLGIKNGPSSCIYYYCNTNDIVKQIIWGNQ